MANRNIIRSGGGLTRNQVLNLLNQQGGGVVAPQVFSDIGANYVAPGTTGTRYIFAWPLSGTWSFAAVAMVNAPAPPPPPPYPTVSNVVVVPSTADQLGRIQFDLTVPNTISPGTEYAVVFVDATGLVHLGRRFVS